MTIGIYISLKLAIDRFVVTKVIGPRSTEVCEECGNRVGWASAEEGNRRTGFT